MFRLMPNCKMNAHTLRNKQFYKLLLKECTIYNSKYTELEIIPVLMIYYFVGIP